jgi:cathepsin A (carboxypeptidase C)
MFVESQSSPKEDPVIFWFDGGPGISSMVGLFSGLGPLFFTHKDLKFVENPYTWNLKANMMYIENPAGVGFSYTPTA